MEKRMGDRYQTNEAGKGDSQISTRSNVGLRDIYHLCTDLTAAEIKEKGFGLRQAGQLARQ